MAKDLHPWAVEQAKTGSMRTVGHLSRRAWIWLQHRDPIEEKIT